MNRPVSGNDACPLGPEAQFDSACYAVLLVHNLMWIDTDPDFAVFNTKDCNTVFDVFPGQWAFACCDAP